MVMTVLLFSLVKFTHGKMGKCEVDKIFSVCEQCLHDWVVKGSVIGGSFFGGSKKGREELKVKRCRCKHKCLNCLIKWSLVSMNTVKVNYLNHYSDNQSHGLANPSAALLHIKCCPHMVPRVCTLVYNSF